MALRLHILFTFLLLSQFYVFAQETREDVEKKANSYFRSEKYIEATPLFLRLISLEPRNADYNYKYGTCLLFNSEEKKKAFKYLNYAVRVGQNVENEAYYFLGKAYHLTFQFDKAIKNYKLYKEKAGNRAIDRLQVDRQIEMCRNGKSLMADITETVVLSKTKIDKESFFRIYDLSDIGGEILVTQEFQTRQDRRNNHIPIIHFPANSNRIYYSSYGENGDNKDIYVRTRLPDRTWSKAQAVFGGVNTEYNEDFPYMSPNRRYLYFCSEGHNSMGGYDIFRSIYDEETNAFGKPENLDIPISSPDNDFLYIVDSLERFAYFASQRTSEGDKVDVYQVRVQRIPLQFVIIKGGFTSLIHPNEKILSINIKNNSGEEVGNFKTTPTGDYLINLPKGGRYEFILNVADKEQNIRHFIDVPYLKEFRPLKQKIIESEKDGVELVEIINLFDERHEDEESIIAETLELRSRMNVNKDEFDLDALDRIFEQRKILSEIGLSAFSNTEIHDLIKDKHEDLLSRREKTETLIKEITQDIVQNNIRLESALRNADSLINIATQSENKKVKEKSILLSYQSLQEAKEAQRKIEEAKKTLLYLEEDDKETKQLLKQAKALKEGVSVIAIADDLALYSILEKNKEFSKQELNKKTRQNAVLEYQEKLNQQTVLLEEIKNKRHMLEQELQRRKDKIEELKKNHEQASRRNKANIETEISREEIAIEDLKLEISYAQQQEEQLKEVNTTTSELSVRIENTEKESILNIPELREASKKNTTLSKQKFMTENNHSELAQINQVDLSKDPSSIDISEDTVEDITENITDNTMEKTLIENEGIHIDDIASQEEKGAHSITENTQNIDEAIEKEETGNDVESQDPFIDASNKELGEFGDEIAIETEEKLEKEEHLTEEQLYEQVNSAKRIAITQNNLQLQKDFSVINHEYLLSQKQYMKSFALIEAEIKQSKIESLIYQIEKETNEAEYLKLQAEIEKQQKEILEVIKSERKQKEINHLIDDELTKGNYDYVNSDNLFDTEETLRQEQVRIKAKIKELEARVEENEIQLNFQGTEEQKITKKQNRHFKIVVEDLEFRYRRNEEKLRNMAAEKALLQFKQTSSEKAQPIQHHQIEKSEVYQEARGINQLIKESREELNNKEKKLAESKLKLKQTIETFKANEELTPQQKEDILTSIMQIDEEAKTVNAIKDDVFQLKSQIEDIIANENEATQEAILYLLEESTESISTTEELTTDIVEVNERRNEPRTTEKVVLQTVTPTQVENLQIARDHLSTLLVQGEKDNIASKKFHQKKINTAKAEVISQESEIIAHALKTIVEERVSRSEDTPLPLDLLSVQQTTLEVERLTAQAEQEKEMNRKQDILDQIIELQDNAIHNVGTHLRQQEQNEIIQQSLVEYELDNLNIQKVKESEEELFNQRDQINIKLLEIDDEIKAAKIERNQAKKKDVEKYTSIINQLEVIKRRYLELQKKNRETLASLEQQKNLDQNKGIAKDAIETYLTYEDEVTIAQSETYKSIFKDINQLHQKQDELKVKIEALNSAKIELNQTIIMDESKDLPIVSSEELEPTLRQMSKLSTEISVLRNEITSLQEKVQVQLNDQPNNQAILENLIARDVAPIKEVITLKAIETGIFMTGEQGSYSDDNPIPIVENTTIGGLIFRVQIGAFSKPVPNNTFDEFHPISGETVRPGLIRYVAGLFNSRNSAERARDQIRSLGYSDAFVVAYCDGERIPVYRAMELINSGACVPEIEVKEDRLFIQSNEAPSSEGFTNQAEEIDLFAYNRGPNAAQAEAAEAKMGLYFTVQVGVYNRPVSADQLFHITPLVTKRMPNGQIRYSSGIFNSIDEARPKRIEVIDKGIDDAFITAYYHGNRISLDEAKRLLAEQGEEVLELNNPTLKRGNEIINKPETTSVEAKTPFLKGKETQFILISKDRYTEYPLQVLNRLNENESIFYYDSIGRSINSFLQQKDNNLSSYAENFNVVEVYNKTHKVLDKSAEHDKSAVEHYSIGQIQLSIEVDVLDINTDLMEVINNAPYTKELSINEKGLKVDFYTLNKGNNEKEIDYLKALLAKLGATFHARYNK